MSEKPTNSPLASFVMLLFGGMGLLGLSVILFLIFGFLWSLS